MKKIKSIIIELTNNIPKLICIFILMFLSIASIISSCGLVKGERTIYIRDNWFINILSFIIFIALIIFIRRKNRKSENLKETENIKKRVFIAIIIIWTCLNLLLIVFSGYKPRADQKYIYKAAIEMTEGNFKSFTEKGYIGKNPQQGGMLLVEYFIALVSKQHVVFLVQCLNLIGLLVAFFAIYKITDLFFENKSISKYTFVSLLLFAPIFFYTTFLYGNILGLTFSTLAIWLQMLYEKKRKWYFIILAGVCIGLAIIIKSNYLIVLIAMVIMFLVDILENKKLMDFIAIIAIIAIYIAMNFATKFTISSITGIKPSKGIPMMSYVAMGMQEGKRAPGWYNGYNRKVYRKSHYNYEEANNKAKISINKRLDKFKNDPKYAIQFFSLKNLSQWNNPSFQGLWINKITNAGILKNILIEFMNIMQTLILLGATIYLILDYKNIKGQLLFLIVVFIGGFLFHTIWEAKCQYTITYFILLIPYSVKGYDCLTNKIINYIKNRKKEGTST